MLQIIRKSNDKFLVNANDVSTKPLSMEELFKVMTALEVEFDEIEMAITELIHNDHKVAEFGINRMFIFSK